MYLAISAVLLSIVIGLMILSHKIKLPFIHRVLHIRSIFVTVALSIVILSCFVFIIDRIDKIMGSSFIRQIIYKIMPQTNISAAFFFLIILSLCIIVSALYCIVLIMVYVFWLKRLSKRSYLLTKNPVTRFFNWIGSFSYDMFGAPEVKDLWVNIGHWIRVMRNIFSVILIAEVIFFAFYLQFNMTFINDFFISKLVKSLYFLPVISWFLLDQIVIYLQAEPKSEDIKLETEENRISHFGNYQKLMTIYDDLFGGQALISHYFNMITPEQSLFSGPTDDQKKRVENPELLEAICRSLNNLVKPLPPSFIEALVDLINGKSVAVFDTVSGDFMLFYLAYLQRNLFLRRKTLIICDTEGQVKDIIVQIRSVFCRLNKLHEIWKISDISILLPEGSCDTDILVCTEEELLHSSIEESFPSFYQYLHDIVVVHSYDIMCRSNTFALRFYSLLKKRESQFLFLIPENNRDIDSELEIRLGNVDISLYNNFNEEAGACILCWRSESFYKTQQAFSLDLYHDFGVGYTIALIALKHGVSRINIHAPEDVPLRSYAATVKYYLSLLTKNYFHVDNISIDSIVLHNPITTFQNKDLSFDVFYDEYNNLMNVAMQALSNCAEITSMVHIISRPYMLRDYFAHRLNMIDHNDRGMQLIVPVYYHDLKAPSVALLIRLREKGMTIDEVMSYMERFGITGINVEEVLKLTICAAFGSNRFTHIYSYFSFGAYEKSDFYNDQYHYTRFITLTNESIYQKACSLTENNVVITGAHHEVLPVPRSSVYNRFLPGQCHSFNGERFEVVSIEDGKVKVRSEETVEREKEYTAIYDIPSSQLEEKPERTWKENSHYCRDLFRIRIARSIRGYFAHTNGLDFYKDNTVLYKLDKPIVEKRDTYCLRLRFLFDFDEKHDMAAAMMVLLMRGILESAIPKNYKDVLVLTRLDKDTFDKNLFEESSEKGIRKDPLPSDWLESDDNELPLSKNLLELLQEFKDTNFEYNNNQSLILYLVDFSDNGSHVLAGIAEEIPRLLNVLYGYLDWVIKNPKLKHCYLRFGYHQIPGIFNLPLVYDYLQGIANYSPDVSGKLRGKLTSFDLSENVCCSFCGRSISVSGWRFDDARIMCEDCYKHRTTERREIQILLKQAYQTLENTYGIKLPEGIKIKFKSAASIRKAGCAGYGGRVLGFYIFSRREIWVERGGPEPCVLSTLIHELTHAWQHDNLNVDKIDLKYLEGHSVYVEIECSRILGQRIYADFMERSVLSGDDVYAWGLQYWKDYLRTESDKNIFHHIQQM